VANGPDIVQMLLVYLFIYLFIPCLINKRHIIKTRGGGGDERTYSAALLADAATSAGDRARSALWNQTVLRVGRVRLPIRPRRLSRRLILLLLNTNAITQHKFIKTHIVIRDNDWKMMRSHNDLPIDRRALDNPLTFDLPFDVRVNLCPRPGVDSSRRFPFSERTDRQSPLVTLLSTLWFEKRTHAIFLNTFNKFCQYQKFLLEKIHNKSLIFICVYL